jgi:hypothetical protein
LAGDSFWRSLRSRSYMKTDWDFESVVPYASNTRTRLCFSRTRRFSKLIRIALGRTKICGSKLESILRKSRGRRPYLAISSLFLNSPLTSVTLPCSSSSVQRILSSFVGRSIRPRLLPAEPGESSPLVWVGDWSASLRCRADLNMSQTLRGRLVENARRVMVGVYECTAIRWCRELLAGCNISHCCSNAPLVFQPSGREALIHLRPEFFVSHGSLFFNAHARCCLVAPAHCAVCDSNAFLTWALRKLSTKGDGA